MGKTLMQKMKLLIKPRNQKVKKNKRLINNGTVCKAGRDYRKQLNLQFVNHLTSLL